MIQWLNENSKTRNRRQARENASDQVAIGFACDWLSSMEKPKQFHIPFDTQFKPF